MTEKVCECVIRNFLSNFVEVMMEEEVCEKVVEVRRMSDRVMAVVLAFKTDVLRLIYVYVLQCGRSLQ